MLNIIHRNAVLFVITCVLFVTAGALWTSPARAQENGQPLRVATHMIEPFVMEQEGELTGFSISFWDALASNLGLEYEWVIVDSVDDQIAAVESGEADAAIAAITINREREAAVDFSYPYFDSGLQILISYRQDSPLKSLADMLSVFFSPVILQLLGLLLLIMLVVAHIVWLLERHRNPDFATGYLQGIWDGFWWAAVTVSTVGYGDKTAKGHTGRLVSLIWIFMGLVLITQLTAGVTATLAVKHLNSQITEVSDLKNRRVATVEGTTSAEYLNGLRLRSIAAPDIDVAIQMLEDDRVDAVLFDAPVLQYYAANEGAHTVMTAGAPFHRESYGIALPEGSPLREEVDQAILAMMEYGEYDTIYSSWFGQPPR